MRHALNRMRQRGAVLIVSLIMLVVMTLFVISMLKTAVIELKIGGASHVAALNMSNAEAALVNFININNGKFAPGFLTLGSGAAGAADFSAPSLYCGGNGDTTDCVTVTGTQLACGLWSDFGTQMGSSNLQAVQFDIQAQAQANTGWGGETVVHQGLQTLAAPGSC